MITYEWKTGTRIKGGIEAQVAGEHLDGIKSIDGVLTADIVLLDATLPTSPIHSAFTWDDAEAAHLHRLEEARHLMRSIVIVQVDEQKVEQPQRAFVTIVDSPKQEYHSIFSVLKDDKKRRQLIRKALAELASWQRRYEDIKEFANIFAQIESTAGELLVEA